MKLIHDITIDTTILSDHNLIRITSNIRKMPSHRGSDQINQTTNTIDFGNLTFFHAATDWKNIAREMGGIADELKWKTSLKMSNMISS